MPFTLFGVTPGTTVGDCYEKAWRTVFRCANGHEGGLSTEQLVARFKPGVTLDAIAARLKCSRCGLETGTLSLRQDTGVTRERDLESHLAKTGSKLVRPEE